MIDSNTCTGIFIHGRNSEDRTNGIKHFFFATPMVILMALAINGLFLVGLSAINKEDTVRPPPPPPETWLLTPYHPLDPVPIIKPGPVPVLPPDSTRSRTERTRPAYVIDKPPTGVIGHLPGSMPVYDLKPAPDMPPAVPDDIHEIFEVDTRPQLVRHFQPVYPFSAKRKNIEGRVTVRFVVDKTGMVLNPFVIDATPEGVFEDAALKAVSRWRFKPAILNKTPVDVYVVVPLTFELN